MFYIAFTIILKFRGGTSSKMGQTYHFRISHPKSSITHAGSPQKIIWPYDKENTLKMSTEILKNDKNNGYRFRFLALLKTYIFIFHFGSPPSIFDLQNFLWCQFTPQNLLQLYKHFFSKFPSSFISTERNVKDFL